MAYGFVCASGSLDPNNLPFFGVPYQMVVDQLVIVKEIDEYSVIVYKAAVNEWIWKILVSHRIIIDPEQFVKVNLISIYLFLCPCCLPKSP